ncbi:MAG: cupredoxin domain-containing protein [Actinomycetota bacterium]|nr:cupredoxin domain-containing protein [Actinomycetota bacterium]
MKKVFGVVLIGAIALVGCSKSGSSGSGSTSGSGSAATCSPGGAELTVSAKDTSFDKKCLAAPADAAFTIALDNKDGFPHNISIYKSKGGADVYKGQPFAEASKTTTYSVPATTAGTYYFQCDIHPDQMNGTFIVK